MAHPFQKLDRKVDGEDKDLYLEKSRTIAQASQELQKLQSGVNNIDDQKVAEMKEAERQAMVDLLKYEEWIEIDLGHEIKNVLGNDFASVLDQAFESLIKDDVDLMARYSRYEKLSRNKSSASRYTAILQILLIRCFEKEETLKKLDLHGLEGKYGELVWPVDGIVGGRSLTAMMQVAFSHIPGYESFDEADFTDPAFMKKYLAKVLGICGLDVSGLLTEEGKQEKDQQGNSKQEDVRTLELPVIRQKEIHVDDDGDMIFDITELPEKLPVLSKANKKAARRTNDLKRAMLHYDVAHDHYEGREGFLSEARRRADKFVDYASADNFELSKFNMKAFAERFYKLYEEYAEMFPLPDDEGNPVEAKATSFFKKQKMYYQAMTLKYILENPKIEKAFQSDRMEEALNMDKFRSGNDIYIKAAKPHFMQTRESLGFGKGVSLSLLNKMTEDFDAKVKSSKHYEEGK